MQPAAASRSGGVSVVKGKGSRVAQADNYVNDEKFWNKKVEDVPADQVCTSGKPWKVPNLTPIRIL
jgi:ribosome biogenesis protein MAK21